MPSAAQTTEHAGTASDAASSATPPLTLVARGLWAAVQRHRRRAALAMALLVLAKCAAVTVPLVLKAIVDRFHQPAALAGDAEPAAMPVALVLPVFLLLAYAALRFLGTLFTELRDLVFARVTQSTSTWYAEQAFAKLMAMSPRFHGRRSTGVLLREIDRGTTGVGFLLGTGLFTVVPTLLEFTAVAAIMAAGYSFWFTVVIFVTFVVYATYTTALTQQRSLRQRRVNQMDERATARLVDSLINHDTVKAFAREGYEQQRYAQICAGWVEQAVENQKALSKLHIGQSAIIAAGVASVMLLAGQHTLAGTMTVGDLVLVNSYILQVVLPLNALGFVFREARDALVNAEALFRLLDIPTDITDAPGARPLVVTGGEVHFEHVGFSYEPGRQVLFDLDLRIGPGQTVAVVGGSGSGKSTLARLLLRFYDVDEGRVLIDGQDVRSVQLASLREAIGVVPQDTVLFNDTIAYNIRYGHPQAGMDQVIAAAQAAQLHELIQSLPQQYDTVVGERGTKLSGGEKQRLAIARAFLKNPPLVIFDEATSALDTRAERAIQGELDKVAEGRSTLIIAHRLSTIVNADQIVVLDKGRIVERGGHDELLAAQGLYAQLWQLQRQQREVERLERRLARQPVQLVDLVARAIEGLREDIQARGIALYTELEAEQLRITGDPSTLAEALQRIFWQAMLATPPGGRMALQLRRRAGHAHIEVTDGRVAAAQAAPPPQAPPSAPHGIGEAVDPLALRSVFERHGGQLQIEPPTPSRGLRFVIDLPLSDDPPPPPLQASEARGDRLLGVDVLCMLPDATHGQEAPHDLQDMLRAEGAVVHTVSSRDDAIAWFKVRPAAQWPRLLLCDTTHTGEAGRDTVRLLRRLEAERALPLERRTPAVAIVARTGSDEAVRALMAGFQAHAARPLERTALLQAVSSALQPQTPPAPAA
jgi:ATP-binding cassette subfamily B protein